MSSERSLFQPAQESDSHTDDPADVEYAEAFAEIAELLKQAEHPELMTLRLSTCRNAYLTVNAIFADVRLALGHGELPSPLSRGIEHLSRREFTVAAKHFDIVREMMEAVRRKRETWGRRQELDRHLGEYLNRAKPVARDRLRSILFAVRTQSADGYSWDPKYYSLSSDEPAHIADLLSLLVETQEFIASIIRVARALSNAVHRPEHTLFDMPSSEALWPFMITAIRDTAASLGCTLIDVEHDIVISSRHLGERPIRIPSIYPGIAGAEEAHRVLVEYLRSHAMKLHDRLSAGFRANVGLPPLPDPFIIDVTESQVRSSIPPATFRTPIRDFNCLRPKSVKVAFLECGIPLSYYDRNSLCFENDGRRDEVAKLASEAIAVAAREKVNVLVLPEYFLPRGYSDRLVTFAGESSLVLVTGEEGGPVYEDSGRLINKALIFLPGHTQPFEQLKQYASNAESPLSTDGALQVFRNTPIGSFAVLVCSDFTEQNIISALAESSCLLDFLIVPAFNDHHELFRVLAMADAYRLYCHVVIANNFSATSQPDRATGEGSFVCSPHRKVEGMIRTDGRSVPLMVPMIGGLQPSIAIHDASIENLARERIKPFGTYLPSPRSRGRPA